MKSLKLQTGIIAGITALFIPFAADAVTLLPPCTATGNCGITDILVVFVNVAEFLLGIVGAVALLYFVYGGYVLITSGGSQERVKTGKDTLRNAIIGIAIVFLSGIIVRFTTDALTRGRSEIRIVGESCTTGTDAGKNFKSKSGLYVTIPAGFRDKDEPAKTVVPEDVQCVAKDDCKHLQALYTARNRKEKFSCIKTTDANVTTCVRGLCPSKTSDYACCLTK